MVAFTIGTLGCTLLNLATRDRSRREEGAGDSQYVRVQYGTQLIQVKDVAEWLCVDALKQLRVAGCFARRKAFAVTHTYSYTLHS